MSTARKKAAPRQVKRAFLSIDARNDFADYTWSAIPVPGGREIGPVIGAVQTVGKETGFFDLQGDVCDAHKPNFFSFASNNRRQLRKGITRVPDRFGVLHTILPVHMIPGTRGFELIDGVQAHLFDRFFRKGEEVDLDQFSGATDEVVEWLNSHGITDVWLGGLVKRICMGTTAINLVWRGFRVHLIEDATRDLEIPAWQDVLDIMKTLKVRSVTSTELITQMRKFAR